MKSPDPKFWKDNPMVIDHTWVISEATLQSSQRI